MTCRRLIVAASLLLPACPADDPSETAEASNATTAPDSTAGDDAALGCAVPEMPDTTDGNSTPLMATWGAPCAADADCEPLLGAGAVCLFQAVIYELPLGYCSKNCVLPDANTMYVPDDPMCDPAGGIDCLGAKGTFEVCAPRCSDDAQCEREGYTCRALPLISAPGDPEYCLMPDCCESTCAP